MKLDKYNLLIGDDNDLSGAAYNTALFFIQSKFKKEEIDAQFRKDYPVRSRLPDEPLVEYDSYLTRHTHAYEEMLNKQDRGYLMHLDINLDYALQTLNFRGSDNLFVNHPELPSSEISGDSALMLSSAIVLYNFGLNNLYKCRTNDIHSKALRTMRKSWHRYLSDAKLLLGLTKNKELATILKEISRRYSPTFITKLF